MTDGSFLGVDIGVPDFGDASEQRRVSWVLIRDSDVEVENAALIA